VLHEFSQAQAQVTFSIFFLFSVSPASLLAGPARNASGSLTFPTFERIPSDAFATFPFLGLANSRLGCLDLLTSHSAPFRHDAVAPIHVRPPPSPPPVDRRPLLPLSSVRSVSLIRLTFFRWPFTSQPLLFLFLFSGNLSLFVSAFAIVCHRAPFLRCAAGWFHIFPLRNFTFSAPRPSA